jgi:hypothetical protein
VKRIARILRELLGLFVDDGSLAIAVLAWVAIIAFILPAADVGESWRALLLFLGCIAILIENLIRSARRHRS